MILIQQLKVCYTEKRGCCSNSIRIGKLMFTKLHPDYMGMQVLNLIFGGLFWLQVDE